MFKNNKKSKGNVQKNNHKENNMPDENNNINANAELIKKLPRERELKKQKEQNDKKLKLYKDILNSYEEIERINDKILKLVKDIQTSYAEIERVNANNKSHTNDLVDIAEKVNQKKLQEMELRYQKRKLNYKSYDFAKWLVTRLLLFSLFGLLIFLGFNYLKIIDKPEIVVKCECENCRRDAINNNTTIYTIPQNQKDENNE